MAIGTYDVLNCNTLTTSLDISGSSTNNGTLSFAWSTTDGSIVSGATTDMLVVDQGGNYTITITDDNNCQVTNNYTVMFKQLIEQIEPPKSSNITDTFSNITNPQQYLKKIYTQLEIHYTKPAPSIKYTNRLNPPPPSTQFTTALAIYESINKPTTPFTNDNNNNNDDTYAQNRRKRHNKNNDRTQKKKSKH